MLRIVCLVAACLLGGSAWADSQPKPAPAPAAKPKAVRIQVMIDSMEMSLAIPPARPATLENEGWSHVLAIVATGRKDASVLLNIAAFPKSEDRASITNEKVIKEAKLRSSLTPKQDVVLTPGEKLPKEIFGSIPPKAITIKWVSK